MVSPYTPQQFFDQPANITNGQLLAINPKFGQMVVKQLRKPIVRKKDEEQDKKNDKKQDEENAPEDEKAPVTQELVQSGLSEPSSNKTSALYCNTLINHI